MLWFGRPDALEPLAARLSRRNGRRLLRGDDGLDVRQRNRGQRRGRRRDSAHPDARRRHRRRSPFSVLAWLSARTTLFVVSTRRVVLKVGIALPIFYNLPFSQIAGASLRLADGTGDVSLGVTKGQRIAYLTLWPAARPLVSPSLSRRCAASPTRAKSPRRSAVPCAKPRTGDVRRAAPAERLSRGFAAAVARGEPMSPAAPFIAALPRGC